MEVVDHHHLPSYVALEKGSVQLQSVAVSSEDGGDSVQPIESEEQSKSNGDVSHATSDRDSNEATRNLVLSFTDALDEDVCSICLDEFDLSADPNVLTTCGYVYKLHTWREDHIFVLAFTLAFSILQSLLPSTMHHAMGSKKPGVPALL